MLTYYRGTHYSKGHTVTKHIPAVDAGDMMLHATFSLGDKVIADEHGVIIEDHFGKVKLYMTYAGLDTINEARIKHNLSADTDLDPKLRLRMKR